MVSSEAEPKPSQTPTPLTADSIAEMLKVDNSPHPTILPIKLTTTYSGPVLNLHDAKWEDWAHTMEMELTLNQLWEFVFDPPPTPHEIYQPRAYDAWSNNNHLASAFIKRALSTTEQRLCADEWNPVKLWQYLRERHQEPTTVQQIRLLKEALTTKCTGPNSLTATADTIIHKIHKAFALGPITKELLQSVIILSSSLSDDPSFAPARSIIERNLLEVGDTNTYGPSHIWRFLENEQYLLSSEGTGTTTDSLPSDTTALPRPSNRHSACLVCKSCKAANRPTFRGHTRQWCVKEGGGMYGKSLEESRRARAAHYDALWKAKTEKEKGTSKIIVTAPSGGTFTIEGDSDAIAAFIPL